MRAPRAVVVRHAPQGARDLARPSSAGTGAGAASVIRSNRAAALAMTALVSMRSSTASTPIANALGCLLTTMASFSAPPGCRSTTGNRARPVHARAASTHGRQPGESASAKPPNDWRASRPQSPGRSRSRHQPRNSLQTPAGRPPRGILRARRGRQVAGAEFRHSSTRLPWREFIPMSCCAASMDVDAAQVQAAV